MNFEIDNMDIHFNKCASDYDRYFYEDLGMCEFYNEIEKQIITCGKPKKILVLGCGTGLEIERIKHSAIVTAIDISSGMLAELKKKELYPEVTLNTVCRDKDTEIRLRNEAEEFYQRQGLPFESMHIDVPLALDTELALLSDAGFNSISVERRWNKTALMKAIK